MYNKLLDRREKYLPNVQLDDIRPDDLEFLRGLRNAERRWFFDAAEVTPDAQSAWHAGLSRKPHHLWYMVRVDGAPAGCFSIRRNGDHEAEVGSILLADTFRGQGVMTQAMGMAIDRLGPGVRCFAEVLPDNDNSLHLFERLGFARKCVVMERTTR